MDKCHTFGKCVFDLKINLGHSDLYFTVQLFFSFYFLLWKTFKFYWQSSIQVSYASSIQVSYAVLGQLSLFFSLFLLYELSLFFLHEMLSKCIDNGYLVGTTRLTVFFWLFWNFADVFSMEWRCACDLGIILWLFFLLCELSLFFWHEMPSKCHVCHEAAHIVYSFVLCAIEVYRYWVPCGHNFLTVFFWWVWHFADVFSMEWRCAYSFGIILWLFFSLFLPSLFLTWNAIKVSCWFCHEVAHIVYSFSYPQYRKCFGPHL